MIARSKTKPKPKPAPDLTFKTIEEVADYFGVSVRTIEKWPQRYPDAGLGKPGKWSVRAFGRLAFAIKGKRHFQDPDGDRDQISKAELRFALARAEEKERENARAAGKLIPREESERWGAAVLTGIRENTMAIPDALANLLPPDLREIAREELDKLARDTLRKARIRVEELLKDQ